MSNSVTTITVIFYTHFIFKLETVLENYRKFLVLKGLYKATVENYLYIMQEFLVNSLKNKEITPEMMDEECRGIKKKFKLNG